MPKSTLSKLPCDGSYMKPSTMIVRAFDGTRREVIGEIEFAIQIGPCTFNILFQVMDIMPTFIAFWVNHGFTLLGQYHLHCTKR